MTQDEMFNAVAPCSLLCYTCFGYINGGIRYHAAKLFELYKGWYSGHYHAYLPEPNIMQQARLESIQQFNETLKGLISSPGCEGCHSCKGEGIGCIKGCIIPKCAEDHKVDFCGNCPEFPVIRQYLKIYMKCGWMAVSI